NYWVCLRRPANPFAPVSLDNPMCVVDSMRFPYIEGTGGTIATDNTYTSGPYNTIYSVQRLQPYRGRHAVAVASATGGTTTITPPDSRYGYTEQVAIPQTPTDGNTGWNGKYKHYGQWAQNTVNAATVYSNAPHY